MEEFEVYRAFKELANYAQISKTEMIINIIVSIGVLVLFIILIVKFWNMANDVRDIKNFQMYGNSNNSQKTIERKTAPGPTFNGIDIDSLKKGDRYVLGKLGVCSYEGMFEGKYGFYPVKGTQIVKSSPYFRDDTEPYYLIPGEKFKEVGIV